MPHPQMFDDADPVLVRTRQIALGFPGAEEKVSHGRPAFFTTKVFAYYSGAVKADGEWVQHDQCVMVLLPEEERLTLRDDARVFVPAYLGASGWLGVDLPDVQADGWDEVLELLDASYRRTAGKRFIAKLDAR